MPKKPVANRKKISKPLKKPVRSHEPAIEAGSPKLSRRGRVMRRLSYRQWRTNHLRVNMHRAKLPSVWALSKVTAKTLYSYKFLFLGIVAVYGVLNVVLVQGFVTGNELTTLKGQLGLAAKGSATSATTSAALFVSLIGTTGSSGSSAYQGLLLVLVSLALIYGLRQSTTAETVNVKDSYYRGMYPLVPFVLVILVIGIQLLPFLTGATIYELVTSSGIAVNAIEQVGWLMLFLLLALSSLYMVSSSVFALYIVTLPDMTPMKALRSARQLVRYRRAAVLLKLAYLPVAVLVLAAVVMVPAIALSTKLGEIIFFLLTIVSIAVIHSYMYSLYRELLRE